ncbi:MAG: M28 family metallopeptidase [Treponema sp.]|nr:M28 family metallopeptidase [Treponema sp.]
MKQNTANWSKLSPYDRYFDFISQDIDRYAVLLSHIESLKLNSAVINIEGNKHIFIFPHGQKSLRTAGGVFPYKDTSPYLLSAHYDRVSGSSGANDNSIAVFHLLKAAILLEKNKAENWIIVFTDKEELKEGESLEDQGSFTLAKKIKTWGLSKAKIYNFDACGTGNVFIVSTTTDHILKDSEQANIKKVRKEIRQLRDYALETADLLRIEKILLAPTPFSDDVGFLRAGLAAQTITILPAHEADKYEALLRSRSDFADVIISGKIKEPSERRCLPETWRCINNANDTYTRLTPQYFEEVVRFITELISH